ncbi:SusC/RagA family TonB-linked outer membrane protein [Pinibacter aurantiacus]|nr:TonB-dependent receptor [Pinibacter aurantiacus]
MKKSLYPRKVFFLLGIVMSVVNVMSAHSQTALNAIAYSQQKHSSPTNAESKTISQLLLEARKVFDVDFVYESNVLPDAALAMNVTKYKTVTAFLDELLKPYGLKYKKVLKKAYVIYANNEELKSLMLSLNIKNNEEVVQVKAPVDTTLTVSGKITSTAKGEILDGVSVTVKGATKGAMTDKNGIFKLAVPGPNAVIVVSMIGYLPQEFVVGNRRDFQVALIPQNLAMEEVVVVGYGQQKKASVTASISTISSKEIVQSPVANISNALAGRLPGLISVQSSGKPGEDAANLYIRGVSTYSASTAPLIMVDGVVRDTYNDIDPNEIETISILKDASATAVFGVRGANGVILITTKRGKEGTPKVSATAQTAAVSFLNMPKYVNSPQYATLRNEQIFETYWQRHANDPDVANNPNGWAAFVAKRSNPDPNIGYKPQYTDEDMKYYQNAHTPTLADGSKNPYYDPYFHPDQDWQSQIYKKYAPQSQANINITGGTKGVKYFLSGGYLTQSGLFKTDYMPFSKEMDYKKDRYNLRGNFDFDVNENLKVSVDLGTQFVQVSGMDNDQYNYEKNLMWTNPMGSPGYIDGKYVFQWQRDAEQFNPLYSLSLRNQYALTNSSTLNSAVRITHKLDFITKGLSVSARAAYDSYFASTAKGQSNPVKWAVRQNPNGDVLDPIWVQLNNESPSLRNSNAYKEKWRKWYAEFAVNYSRTFGDHSVTGLVMGNLEKKFDPKLPYDLPHAYEGIVGRIAYGYKGKYLAEYNMGYNGSENFPEGQRFGFFPAYSLGWVASNESFWPVNQYFTYLKVRGSLGYVGNDGIYIPGTTTYARYLYLPDVWGYGGGDMGGYYFGVNGSNRNKVKGAYESTLGNPNVSWEVSQKMNIGFEAKFFKDKLGITYDHYDEHRKDILSYRGTVPGIVAASLPPYNLGETRNWGNELEVTYNDKVGRKFNYWVKANISNNQNKIVFRDEPIVKGLEYQAQTGKPINQGSYLQANGLYTSWSQLYAVDANNNPILSQPVAAKDANGKPYTNAGGQTVLERDLSLGAVPLQPGDIRMNDYNYDGVIDNKDYVRSGYTSIPRFTYGVSFGFNYKGWDFSVLFQGAGGVAADPMPATNKHFNGTTEALFAVDWNRFTPERYAAGEKIDFPIAAYNPSAYANTYFHLNTAYVRLKNMEVGYTFQHGILSKAGIGSVRVYANGFNMYTWSKNSIWGDPENLGYMGYPLTRTYNAGFKVSF